jgi:hypothetical protein
VPDFVPVLGQLDDALLVVLVLRYVVRSAGREVGARELHEVVRAGGHRVAGRRGAPVRHGRDRHRGGDGLRPAASGGGKQDGGERHAPTHQPTLREFPLARLP